MSVHVPAHPHLQLGRAATTSSHTKPNLKVAERGGSSFAEPQQELVISAEPK